MKLTNNYKLISVRSKVSHRNEKRVPFDGIQKYLNGGASRVGSSLRVSKDGKRVVFYLDKRPKDRQGRLDWNQIVNRASEFCKERYANYSPTVVIARNGNELELRRKK